MTKGSVGGGAAVAMPASLKAADHRHAGTASDAGRAAPAVDIIIAAHNESRALPICLNALLDQDYTGRMHVIVSANGCTDDTAGLARTFRSPFAARGHRLAVIELDEPSKPRALNAGLAIAAGDVHVFLDADVKLSPTAVSAIARRLAPGFGRLLCAPRLAVAPVRARLCRAYARIWAALPYVQDQVIGCGCYALNAEGRSRLTRFPDIISDDKFVRLHFTAAEQQVAREATFTIYLPERFSELLAIRTRWCRGNSEVARLFPHLLENDRARWGQALRFILSRPTLWPAAPVFAFVYLLGHWRGRSWMPATPPRWERTETSGIRCEGTFICEAAGEVPD